ncbi:MAG: serine/threonine protein kinase [Gemmataceae bacterium]|nr:serine/threonine protein kinase [Gemmataceae bacterium]
MALTSAAELVDALRLTPLLEPSQRDELGDLSARFPDSKSLAKELLRRGWLSAFQVNQLLQDRAASLVLGPYVLLERLGEGGMGEVFRARHAKMHRIVAVKLIRKERLTHPDAVRRFRREVQAAAQLSHPNVVHAFDADQVADTQILVMEYVEGADLGKLVKERGPLSVEQACDYIRQAALGLQHAHEKGLVHRDIKPSNLLVSRDAGVVKILDLGLARLTNAGNDGTDSSSLTETGTVMGTLDYLSPEQGRNSHGVDIRADLYSLGCTFYHLLTGRAPYAGDPAATKIYKHQFEDPPPVESLRPDVPAGVAEVVRKLMTKAPEGRYQTPGELAAALASRRWPGTAAGEAPAPIVGRRRPIPIRKLWIAAAVVLLTLSVVLFAILRPGSSQRTPSAPVAQDTKPLPVFDPRGVPVPLESRVGPQQVHGLRVEFYDFYPKDAQGIDSLKIAKDWIATHKPDVAYDLNLRAIDFPPGPTGTVKPYETTLGQFLLGDKEFARRKGTGPPPPQRFDTAIGSRTIYVFTGYIRVGAAGACKIMAPCDDQAEVSIGNVVVHSRPGFGAMNSPDAPENVGWASFADAGIYPIKVLFYDRDPGAIGIEVFSDLAPRGELHANGKVLLAVLPSAGQ